MQERNLQDNMEKHQVKGKSRAILTLQQILVSREKSLKLNI